MAAPSSLVVPDPTKILFDPSNSVMFVPDNKKQVVRVEITNNSAIDVAIKFKSTNPVLYKTAPPSGKIGVGEKKIFLLIFKGLPKNECKVEGRFVAVCIAILKNEDNIEKAFKRAPKAATMKHKFRILFEGMKDDPEDEKAPEDLKDL